MDKLYNLNLNRKISIATKFIPKEAYHLYEQEICNGCTYNNKSEEQLACCYCQDGSLYNIEGGKD